jgi:hypothetical protein
MCDPFLDAFILISKTSHKNPIVCKIFKAKNDGGGGLEMQSVSTWSHVTIKMLLHELECFLGI